MQINEMHYNFKLLSDKIDAQDRRNFMPWEIDMLLWQATMTFIKSRYDVSRSTSRGFETDQKRISDLSTLHIKSPELQPYVVPTYLGNGRYEVNLNQLGNNINGSYYRYMFSTKVIVEITKNDCTKLCELFLQQTDDRRNTYNKPSWTWCQLTGNFGRSTFQVDTVDVPSSSDNSPDFNQNLVVTVSPGVTTYINDELASLYIDVSNSNGGQEFAVSKVYISYIKFPNRVYSGGYDHIDGFVGLTPGTQIHCDLDDSVHDEIVREAVKIAYMPLGDQQGLTNSAALAAQDKQNP